VINPGATSATHRVEIRDDQLVEQNETVSLRLLRPWLAKLGDDRTAAVKIIDNDAAYALSVLHINDHHSRLQPDTGTNLLLDGRSTRVEIGGFPRVVAKMNELQNSSANVIKLHAGDAITGTIFYSLFKGEADADLMNRVCFDAFALGNHEFDDGDGGLADFLRYLNADPASCDTPVLAANVVPAIGTPLRPNAATSLIQPYVVKEINGEQVGVIGIDIADKTQISSSPLDTTEFLDEQQTAQFYIDELQAMGVNKIIVLSHFQYANEVELARSLRGVDIVVGGDSHTLLGEDFSDFGLNPGGPYPTVVSNADGDTACVVQAWQYAAVVGELAVQFNEAGQVLGCDGTPHLLLGDSFQRVPAGGSSRVELAGAERQAVYDVVNATPELSIVNPDPLAQAIVDEYAVDVEILKQTIVGVATEDLCVERIPDQGRSTINGCREKTRVNGGDIQQLVTEAFLRRSFRADVALQNAGGVRNDIPAGDISINDVFTLLPFANTLVELELTGAEIKRVLEEAGDSATGISTGAYPYAANLRWDADLSQPSGSRFSNLQIRRKGSPAWVALEDEDHVVVVTNSFLAGGGDGYFTFEQAAREGRIVDTFIDYAQALIDYLQQDVGGAAAGEPVLVPAPEISAVACADYSTQSFIGTDGIERIPAVNRTCN
jgi:5'-nucleotidase